MKLFSPKIPLFTAMISFVIALIDSLIHNASGFGDLHWWGLTAISICGLIFLYIIIMYIIIPVGYAIMKLFKK